MKPFRLILFLVSLLIVGTGCATYTKETQQMRGLYRGHQYSEALESLEKSGVKTQNKNRLLYRMEKAMILDRMGEGKKARKLLIEADAIADELYTVSISKTAASFVVNDSATDYSGEDYEKVAIHTMLALSFIEAGDYKSAQVSARKINNKLHEINQGYEKSKNKYSEDAFARYLSGTIYEAQGDIDDALIDYRKALDLYRNDYQRFYHGGIPESLVLATHKLASKKSRTSIVKKLEKSYPKILKGRKEDLRKYSDYGELVVLHELGHITVKTNEEFVLPIGRQVVRFSFPVIRPKHYRSHSSSSTGVEVEGRGFIQSENLQDMDAIASQTLADKRGRMLIKGAARLLAKGQLTEAAYENFGPLAGLAANAYSAVTETGDTRGWTLLPEQLYVTRISLKPGKHKITIKSGGRVKEIRTVDIKKRKILILRDN